MAPLPINGTGRLVVDYIWRGRPYQVLYRFQAPTTASAIVTGLNTFHAAVDQLFHSNWSVPGTANVYLPGDNFSNPQGGLTPVVGSLGADPLNFPDSYQIQVVGRSNGNRKVSYYYQGFQYIGDVNQRISSADNANVSTFLAAFAALRNTGLVTISGLAPSLKSYVNIVFNDYLTRRSRAG